MSFHSPNHRCENCIENDDDYGDEDLEDDNLDDHQKKGEDVEGSVNQASVQEESSESLFSLSIDSRRQVSAVEKAENEVNSPIPVLDYCYSEEEAKEIGSSQNARDRIQSVCSVLNPIENLSEWKVVKATVTQPVKHQAKENINSEQGFDIPSSPEPNLKVASCYSKSKSSPLKHQEHEIGVDTSLSSWLIESETTPKSKNSTTSVGNSPSKGTSSPMSREDRPILGALTIEELRLFSASTTPRRTRHRSPDETPIIGTVGSYWSHTGQATDSDSSSSCGRMPNRGTRDREALGKDRRVKWNSTQFKFLVLHM
ncbi:Protein JASON-like [Quillaja saponaria]|uniref:Protein JASON-like n=1 Tax=Quillaja saponaria TaxID=32244 RepID=A0AAD7QB90_QUISA|nr:Protein JASON-like [Quillaja saponaria]